MIDWVSHGRALNRMNSHKSTLVKYLNDILPVGKVVHRYDPKYPLSCPSCPAAIEDRDHFWRCPAISWQQWRKDCKSNMLQALNKFDTAPPVQSLLLDALDALMHGKPLESITIHPLVEEVAEAQAQVGWHQILKGRFVSEWKQAQERYYRGTIRSNQTTDVLHHEEPNQTHLATGTPIHDKKRTGEIWMTNVITTWLQQWLNLWKMRNEDRHGRDDDTRRQARDNQTIHEATLFYNEHATRVNPTLQWLFEIPLTTRTQGNISTLRIWLRTWKPVVEKSYTTALETG